jgi:hypothetical protein
MYFLLFFGLRVGWWCWSSWRCQRRMSTWVGARITEVTLLSTIVALSVSSDLVHIRRGLRSIGVRCRSRTLTSIGASIGKWPTCPQLKHAVVALANVEPSLWLGAAFLVVLIFCALPESSWVLLSLSWWGSCFYRLQQLVDVLHLH